MTSQVILVFGATGSQGGSVVRALQDSKYKIRAVTRNPSGAAAKALAAQGIEVVQADITNQEQLDSAFKGVYGVFAVTNFFTHFSKEQEIADGKRLVDTAAAAGVQHYIWSTLGSYTKWSNGKYPHAAHCDGKAAVDDYIRTTSLLPKTTFLSVPFYYQNLISGDLNPRKQDDGSYVLALPISRGAKFPGISVDDDVGSFARGILEAGEEVRNGTYVYAMGGMYTFEELIQGWAKKAGVEKAAFVEVTDDQFISFVGKEMGQDLGSMFRVWEEIGPFGPNVDPSISQKYCHGGQPKTFEEWISTVDLSKYL